LIQVFLLAVFAAGQPQTVLVETEHFSDFGGWVHDPQFMDQVGSPFLLAHGLEIPVADATTTIEFPAAGVLFSSRLAKDAVAAHVRLRPAETRPALCVAGFVVRPLPAAGSAHQPEPAGLDAL
jgi:hypothetical protein